MFYAAPMGKAPGDKYNEVIRIDLVMVSRKLLSSPKMKRA
mgnify:FL=1